MAGQELAGTTGLYDQRSDEVAFDKIERIAYWTPRLLIFVGLTPQIAGSALRNGAAFETQE